MAGDLLLTGLLADTDEWLTIIGRVSGSHELYVEYMNIELLEIRLGFTLWPRLNKSRLLIIKRTTTASHAQINLFTCFMLMCFQGSR
jgi:hypothetical protein